MSTVLSDEDTGPPNQDDEQGKTVRFESLDLPPLPADRSDFNVHGALEDGKAKTKYCYVLCVREYIISVIKLVYIISIILGYYARFVHVVVYVSSLTRCH